MEPLHPSNNQARVVLARSGLFHSLEPRWIDALAQIAIPRTFLKGTIIFRQGEDCPGMYVVATGNVRVFKVGSNGKEHVLHLAGRGSTFAEVAVLGNFPCPANAEASEDSTCVLLPKAALAHLLATHHELCLQLLAGMALWVRQLVSLLEDVVLRDASGRVARYLLSTDTSAGSGSFALPALKKDLASHLNLTSETFSRTLRRLSDARLIELDGQKVLLLDTESLRQVADGVLPAELAE